MWVLGWVACWGWLLDRVLHRMGVRWNQGRRPQSSGFPSYLSSAQDQWSLPLSFPVFIVNLVAFDRLALSLGFSCLPNAVMIRPQWSGANQDLKGFGLSSGRGGSLVGSRCVDILLLTGAKRPAAPCVVPVGSRLVPSPAWPAILSYVYMGLSRLCLSKCLSDLRSIFFSELLQQHWSCFYLSLLPPRQHLGDPWLLKINAPQPARKLNLNFITIMQKIGRIY